jgi:adenosine kinase
MEERTGLSPKRLAEQVEAVIVTRGGNGSIVHTREREYHIPVVRTAALVDPTGCGDAYRAGLLYGLLNDMDWEVTGRIAALMGAIKIEQAGTQNHHFTPEHFAARFQESFGFSFA